MWQDLLKDTENPRYRYTLKEILQQPSCWKKTASLVLNNSSLKAFLNEALQGQERPILVSGAGSSEFVGQSVLQALANHTKRCVINAPTTDIVTNPSIYSIPCEPALMISFARSGNSPESLASVELIKTCCPKTKHLIITCNKEGSLAKNADDNIYVLLLPEETNDQSLVMTSSFSSMVLAAGLLMVDADKAKPMVEKICTIVEEIFQKFPDKLNELVSQEHINRIQYLGTGDGKGVLTEGHLKMLEMTDGAAATRVDTFLGLRHGPQVFVNAHALVAAVLSTKSYIRSYEFDLLKEMKEKKQGCGYIVIGEGAASCDLPNLIAIETAGLCEFFRIFPALITVQLLGFFKSLSLGLNPDAPSASGTINRVVQGVTIYPYKH